MKTSKALLLVLSLILTAAGIIGLTSCGSSTPATTTHGNTQTSPPPGQTTGPDFKPAAVSMENFSFVPADLTVAVGTTVTWTNNDAATHTVTSDTGLFDSKDMGKGSTFNHTFNEKGTFSYHCALHSSMKGTITVQ
jgi:plastocyanin